MDLARRQAHSIWSLTPCRELTRFAIGEELKKAGTGLYNDVSVRTVLDREATIANLDAVVTELAKEIHPRDTFVFLPPGMATRIRDASISSPGFSGGANPEALTSSPSTRGVFRSGSPIGLGRRRR